MPQSPPEPNLLLHLDETQLLMRIARLHIDLADDEITEDQRNAGLTNLGIAYQAAHLRGIKVPQDKDGNITVIAPAHIETADSMWSGEFGK